MLKFLASLSFLYIFSIIVLILFGWLYYREFARSRAPKKRFPVVFTLITAACLGFLWINFHPPLGLKTFSNLDHHFIRHDGFVFQNRVELGLADTSGGRQNHFNRFVFQKEKDKVTISSPYSEEPFFLLNGRSKELLSANYPVAGTIIRFKTNSYEAIFHQNKEGHFELQIGDGKYTAQSAQSKKNISLWNLFSNNSNFANAGLFADLQLSNSLKNIFIIHSAESKVYYLSGKLHSYINWIKINDAPVTLSGNNFSISLPPGSRIGWGQQFGYSNTNQFMLRDLGNQGILLEHIYPISYPLTEEKRDDWSEATVNKFLVPGPTEMTNLPGLFTEGYKFSLPDSNLGFQPIWLSYQRSGGSTPVALKARSLENGKDIPLHSSKLLLPSKNGELQWVFTIQDTLDWKFGAMELKGSGWKLVIFGALSLFFLFVFISALIRPAYILNWAWQLVCCIAMVLLTSRFFLYWRYKSFPPFDGLDDPSYQQLNSPWNFMVIVIVTLLMAIIFSFSMWKRLFGILFPGSKSGISIPSWVPKTETSIFKTAGTAKLWFLGCWFILLGLSMAIAALNSSNAALSRYLTLVLIISYFLAVFISYRHSPLVAPASKSWWTIRSGNWSQVLFANPMKAILSLSLLAAFAFIDIGFAIIFLNFVLFNEAFLTINYAIAGYSGGRNTNLRNFAIAGSIYLLLFIGNLLYAPAVFDSFLSMPAYLYIAGYALLSFLLAYYFSRLIITGTAKKKISVTIITALIMFGLVFLFLPRERILAKAEMTKYRVAVMTKPVDQVIQEAYESGDGYEPVIRAAQNQWFINTFIYEKNNLGVNSPGFNLLPHAPQHKGAKYNAQATDLVASRFLIAEHGNWSVIFYVLLLLIPSLLLASFYKIYPDFTNRINPVYPQVTIGFSIFNYLLITALLVILAATGRYIFFGQDLPFESILSKQSILFPSFLLILAVLVFAKLPLEQYPNRKKFIPGTILFGLLAVVLFFAKPVFNKEKDFKVAGLSDELSLPIESSIQPILDHFDSTMSSGIARKDRSFTDSLKKLLESGQLDFYGKFFVKELGNYARGSFLTHLDQRKMIYLDASASRPRLVVNENYFRVEPPPHLQQYWAGSVYADSSVYNISIWEPSTGSALKYRLAEHEETSMPGQGITFRLHGPGGGQQLWMINTGLPLELKNNKEKRSIRTGDSLLLENPAKYILKRVGAHVEKIIVTEPDAFMKNYFVNGSRYYVYPLAEKFIWARNFAESVAATYVRTEQKERHAFISVDRELTDSLTGLIDSFLGNDTSYYRGAEYAITIVDGEGRLIAMPDRLNGISRPDPNDKPAFNELLYGRKETGSAHSLRKLIGNLNLLRMNPGPGSTLKPVVFASIASQLNLNWEAFASEGFSTPQRYFGGEKVAEYDFEKYNGRISSVSDYLKLSDNYYHSNLMLIGSYSRQDLNALLSTKFSRQNPSSELHWPNFNYQGRDYWLSGFENWPGYQKGKADFGSDSSFIATGLRNNFSIVTRPASSSYERFSSSYDSLLFLDAHKRSGYLMPEYALFDQQGREVDHRIPYDLFAFCFRGHVKGSSQVMIPPVKMADAYGKLITQNRDFALSMDPYRELKTFSAFETDPSVNYSRFNSLMKEQVFRGMREALFNGTAARLGSFLKDGTPYYYYAKTGTTGDNEKKTKSKLLTLIISEKDITDPDFNFRNNRFYIIYFSSQNGPAKQNEELQAAVIRMIERSRVFKKYMLSVRSSQALLAERK